MTAGFVGRSAELARLRQELTRVKGDRGRLLVVRGRRQVGKSTLLERFADEADVPYAYFVAASRARPDDELAAFVAEVAASNLEAAESFRDISFSSWDAALGALARATTRPSVVVVDEFPFLLDGDPAIEGVLQRQWDRALSRSPILLVLIGSNVAVMDLLTAHDHPLFGRAGELGVGPLTPADTAALLGLDAGEAFDAQLVTGGLPRLCAEWRDTVDSGSATPALDFVSGQLGDATSPLVVLGERALAAEFPPQVQARSVLETIGAGATNFARLSERTGITQGSLVRSLATLTEGGLVAVDRPVSSASSRLVHYRVADPYLRFWLRFVGPDLERILRGRGDLVSEAVRTSWPTYRGMAVEPVVREAIERLLPDPRTGAGSAVGHYWIRDGSLEIDLVIADRAAPSATVSAVGSIKWRDQGVFDRHDVAELHRARALLPGAGACPTVAVTRAGLDGGRPDGVDVHWSAADLLSAWRPS